MSCPTNWNPRVERDELSSLKLSRRLSILLRRYRPLQRVIPLTNDPVGNIRAIEKLIPKNAQVMQAVQTHALRQTMDVNEATLLQLIQSINPAIGQNVNVKA
jgi:hypothetical protein